MVNKLSLLAAQIRDEPNQDGFRLRKNQYKIIADQVEAILNNLLDAGRQLSALVAISDDESIKNSSNNNIGIINNVAVALSKLVSANSLPSNNAISAQISSLNLNITEISNRVNNYWQGISASEVEISETLIELTGHYDPKSQNRIKASLAEFKNTIASIPSTKNQINSYKSARESLKNSRSGLSIEGPASSFLLDALNDSGNPKDLLDQNVVDFLNQHPILWKSLKVGFH
jgi:hypothetical protein